MTIEQIQEKLQERLSGTGLEIKKIIRKCSSIEIEYSRGVTENLISYNLGDLDKNDLIGCLAGDIMMEEVQ